MQSQSLVLYDFATEENASYWRIVDDVVMGGRSNGQFSINENGKGLFYGTVSLENNGGFSSVRYRCDSVDVSDFKFCVIRVKGDGKKYQVRVKEDKYDRHSYIKYIQTTGAWETIKIPLKEMYPTFRGRRLNMTNFPGTQIEEFAILISNKREESFKLEMDWIRFE